VSESAASAKRGWGSFGAKPAQSETPVRAAAKRCPPGRGRSGREAAKPRLQWNLGFSVDTWLLVVGSEKLTRWSVLIMRTSLAVYCVDVGSAVNETSDGLAWVLQGKLQLVPRCTIWPEGSVRI